ncbi:CIR protein [Plasmodium chabaudi chabaudi]|uniref:CIR protein n=1 Tax=Plasmodium chabaudi chabaudi TaxID=31271 RepID=A0A1D3L9L0_PLACU|nr:CIR protein [Plasmodium chabaudi chabaudi]
MLKDLCGAIDKIDTKISLDANDPNLNSDDYMALNKYCPFVNNGNEQKCKNYEEIIISAFMTFLVSFISSNGNEYLDRDNFAEYTILWLCYQLNQKTKISIDNLNEFYNNYIKGIEKYSNKLEDADNYNSCMDIINKKQYLMNMDIKEMSKLYEALKKLCKLYNECNEKNNNYLNCSQDAQDFANNFESLNQDSNITGNNLYREILFSLSNDYDDFKNYCAKNCSSCNNLPTLSEIKAPQSSSIESKLIPALLIFAIPLFLGIAYKYSLFGFDKQRHRQYLREKLKKIKKKMASYI